MIIYPLNEIPVLGGITLTVCTDVSSGETVPFGVGGRGEFGSRVDNTLEVQVKADELTLQLRVSGSLLYKLSLGHIILISLSLACNVSTHSSIWSL